MGKRGKARRERRRARVSSDSHAVVSDSHAVHGSVPTAPKRPRHRVRADQPARVSGADRCAGLDADQMYTAEPTFVLVDTLACAFHGCVVCAYKVCVTPGGGGQGRAYAPNERPERCLRALGVLRRPTLAEPPARCGVYSAGDRILAVGDGDLSFSAALVQSLQQRQRRIAATCAKQRPRVAATSVESEARLCSLYARARESLATLRAHAAPSMSTGSECTRAGGVAATGDAACRSGGAADVGFEVDATRLVDTLPLARIVPGRASFPCFDCCVFNFPCIRVAAGLDAQLAHLEANRHLVSSFCRQAALVVVPGGEVHITHKSRPPFSLWDIVATGTSAGLLFRGAVVFDREVYPNYLNRKALSTEAFTCFDARTYVFQVPGCTTSPHREPRVCSVPPTAALRPVSLADVVGACGFEFRAGAGTARAKQRRGRSVPAIQAARRDAALAVLQGAAPVLACAPPASVHVSTPQMRQHSASLPGCVGDGGVGDGGVGDGGLEPPASASASAGDERKHIDPPRSPDCTEQASNAPHVGASGHGAKATDRVVEPAPVVLVSETLRHTVAALLRTL